MANIIITQALQVHAMAQTVRCFYIFNMFKYTSDVLICFPSCLYVFINLNMHRILCNVELRILHRNNFVAIYYLNFVSLTTIMLSSDTCKTIHLKEGVHIISYSVIWMIFFPLTIKTFPDCIP